MEKYSNLSSVTERNNIVNKLVKENENNRIISKLKAIDNLIESLYQGKTVNLLCIHHYDLDGYGVYMVIRLLEKLYPTLNVVYKEETTKVTKKSLTTEIAQFFDYIIIGDLSFDDEFTEDELKTFEVMGNVALLDHHMTALHLNKYDFCHIIVHINEYDLLWTGTSLLWIYFRDCITDKFKECRIIKNRRFNTLVSLISMYDTYYWKSHPNNILSDISYKLNILFKNGENKYLFMDTLVDRIYNYCYYGEDDSSFILTERELDDAELIEKILNKELDYYLNKIKLYDTYSEKCHKLLKIGYVYYSGINASELGNRACNEKNIDICVMVDMNDNMKLHIRSTITDCIVLFNHLKEILGDSNFGGHPYACGANNLNKVLVSHDIESINKLLMKGI